MTDASWLVITWRLGSDSSTPRVATWRTLRRLGAVVLTPGAAVVPYNAELLEQLDWLAESITESGGDAWVLPVTRLSDREEDEIRRRMRDARAAEYVALRGHAGRLRHARPRDLATLERRFDRVVARDYFRAPGRATARRTITRAHVRRSARGVG